MPHSRKLYEGMHPSIGGQFVAVGMIRKGIMPGSEQGPQTHFARMKEGTRKVAYNFVTRRLFVCSLLCI